MYTTLFPQRSDRIVLDSNLGPGGWDYPSDRAVVPGVEDRFPDFAKFAAANHPSTVWADAGPGDGEVLRAGRPVGQEAGRGHRRPLRQALPAAQLRSLYGDDAVPAPGRHWQALDANQPPPPELPGGEPDAENLVSGRLYMICNDACWPKSVATYQRDVAVDRISTRCSARPAPTSPPAPTGPNRPSRRCGSPTTARRTCCWCRTCATRPPRWPGPVSCAKAFGDRAAMVTADQGGHGVYLVRQEPLREPRGDDLPDDGRTPGAGLPLHRRRRAAVIRR